MSTATPESWAALAYHLQLSPHEPTGSYTFGASFRQIRHALGAPATGLPSFGHWLHGSRRGTEVVFLTFAVQPTNVPQQVGPSMIAPVVYCGAIARIDPPLFLGLGIGPKISFLHRDLFGAKAMRTGNEDVDRELTVVTSDEPQARAFFSPLDPAGAALLATMARARSLGDGLLVSDSLVLCPKQGIIVDPGLGATLLDAAIDLARACAQRRRAIPAPASLRAIREVWGQFARTHGFAYDEGPLALVGAVDGSTVEIAFENEGQVPRTAVTVRFPSPIGVAFSATRTNEGFLRGLFNRDIRVGHAKFDELFTVTGHPESAVKAIFARPELADVLTRIGTACSEVQMNHREIHYRLPRVCSSEEELHEIAVMAHVATQALFGTARVSPYRG